MFVIVFLGTMSGQEFLYEHDEEKLAGVGSPRNFLCERNVDSPRNWRYS